MSDKKDAPPPLQPGDFQLDPKMVHVNPLIDGQLRKGVQEINEMDLNHDGKRDIAQLHAAYVAVVPMLALLNECVDLSNSRNNSPTTRRSRTRRSSPSC